MKSRIILVITTIWLGCLMNASALLQWPLTVTNIAELKGVHIFDAITAESGGYSPVIFVMGYYTPGDRGGGAFEWNPNCSQADDGGRYITTNGWTTGNGR